MRTAIVGAVLAVLILCGQVGAQTGGTQPNFRIVVNEYGFGYIQDPTGYWGMFPGYMMPDPTGGVTEQPVLIYNIPLGPGVAGDVNIIDMLSTGGGVLNDVIRFTGQGQLIFYSDNEDGADALADTPHAPDPPLPNVVQVVEEGVEGFNWAYYTPLPNQPGFVPGMNVSYKFFSDSGPETPEPATLSLLALGGLALLRRRRS